MALEHQSGASAPAQSEAPATVRVWDLPLRLMHWTLAASVLVAWFTANVFDTVHEIAGYTTLVAVVLRLIWGVAGPRHARFQDFVRPPRAVWRYLVQAVRAKPGRYLGLNPAGGAMAVVLLALLAVATVSGWMQITERFFGVEWVELLHAWSSNLTLALVVVHVAGVITMSALQNENLVGAMITGRKRNRA